MSTYLTINDKLLFDKKGVAPQYVSHSNTIVLNQKCVRNGAIDYSFAQYIDDKQRISADKYIEIGDVLLNSTGQGTAGRCGIVNYIPAGYKVTLDSHMLRLRFDNIDIARFFTWSVHFQEKYILGLLTGSSGQGELDRDIVYNIAFPYKRNSLSFFSSVYENITKKIENNNRISHELEAMAKTIYDYWFLQFDFPDENGQPYKSSGGKMVWNKELKREIPDGWEVDSVKSFIEHINTGLNPRDNFKLGIGDIRYITVKNLTTDGTIDFSNCDVINESARAIVHRRSDVSKHDILFASIAPLGRCCIVQENPVDWDINESVFCIRPKLNKVSSPYLYQFFMSDEFVKRAEHSSTGSVFSGIRIGVLESMKLFVPTKKVMDKFTEAVSGALYMKYKLMCQNRELTSLRDFLLPLLMNGQVTIKNAIPTEARTTTDSLSYGMQLVFTALQQSGGYLPLNTLADMFAILGSSKEMQEMIPKSDEKMAWSKNLPNLAINDTLLVQTIDQLIEWGLLGVRTVNGVRELLLIGDWPIDKVEDPWIEIDSTLAVQAIQNWDERLRVKNPLVLRFREILERKQYIAA